MKKKKLIRILLFICIYIGLRVLLITGIEYINEETSSYINAEDNQVTINETTLNEFSIIKNIKSSDNETTFLINSSNDNAYIIIDYLTFPHEIYLNNELVSQNINENAEYYNSDYSYKTFKIPNSISTEINITGSDVDKISYFLANEDVINASKEIRLGNNILMLLCLFAFTCITLYLFIKNTNMPYFLVFVVIGIVSIIKSIGLGELFVLVRLFGLTGENFIVINNITDTINTVLPFFILLNIFNIRLSKKQSFWIIGILSIILIPTYIIYGYYIFYYLLCIVALLFNIFVSLYGFTRKKRYYIAVIINNTIYSSLALLHLLIRASVLNVGELNFYINFAYLGALCYMVGYLLIFIDGYSEKIKELQIKEKAYERLILLRGINHDLKLPISIIKITNQMIEKYDLKNDKKKQYLKASDEAVFELEEMTNNISSYLMLDEANTLKQESSIKESLEKINSIFGIYGRYKNIDFILKEDEKDCLIAIQPILFERMLYNLIDNAFKYNKDNGEVELTYKNNKEIEISVRDSGIGLTNEEIQSIFKPFYRSDSSRNKEGLGLGLSVVSGVLKTINATIDIKSEVNKGTLITIKIPK